MPRVYNLTTDTDIPESAVYVGRGSKWGNPFSHLPHTSAKFIVSNRIKAIVEYCNWLSTQPHLLSLVDELAGLDLVCWCAPKDCHADVLLRLANPSGFDILDA